MRASTALTGILVAGLFAAAPAPAADTTVRNTILDVSSSTDLGPAILLDSGTLRLHDPRTISGTTLQLDAGGGVIDTNGNATTLNVEITDAGTFTKTGAGTLTLSGMNSFTGETVVNDGTLAFSGQGRINSSSKVTVNAIGVLDVSGAISPTAKQLFGSGSVVLGDSSLNVGSGNFSGVISGNGGVSVTTGTLVLTGNNTFSG